VHQIPDSAEVLGRERARELSPEGVRLWHAPILARGRHGVNRHRGRAAGWARRLDRDSGVNITRNAHRG
jgi:hypothetical protein